MDRQIKTPSSTEAACVARPLFVPNNRDWLGAFSGVLLWLTRPYNWVQLNETDLTPEEAALQAQSIIDQYFSNQEDNCMGCCTEPLKRVTEGGVVQTSTDGGVTWVNTPSADPRQTSILFPPLPGENGNEKRCKAAENVASAFKDDVDQLVAELGVYTSYAAFVLGVAALFAVVLSGGTFLPAVAGLATLAVGLTASTISATMTTDVYNRFKCNLYCYMDSTGTLTNSAIDLVKTRILVDEETSGAAEILTRMVDNYGYIGLNNLARLQGSGDGDTCSECDCSDVPWCVNMDFSTGNDYGFTSAGTWDGTGFLSTDPVTVGGEPRYRAAGLNFFTVPAGSRLEAVTMYFEAIGGSREMPQVNEVGVTAEGGQTPSIEEVIDTAIETGFLTSGLLTLDWDGAARVYAAVDSMNSGNAKLTRVWVSGFGEIPPEWSGYPLCE